MVCNQSYTYMISIPRRGYLLLCLFPFSERLLVGRDMRRTLALWAQLSYVTSSAYVLLIYLEGHQFLRRNRSITNIQIKNENSKFKLYMSILIATCLLLQVSLNTIASIYP